MSIIHFSTTSYMITNDDKLRAIKISQALQDWFDSNRELRSLRSTDVYEILVKKNLVEKDRHNGVKFREFLIKLKNNQALDLIPQCRIEQTDGKFINGFFESTPNKTIKSRNLIPINKINDVKTLDIEEIKKEIEELSKRKISDFDFIELGTRKKYPRAYECWTKKEEDLLLKVVKEITDPFELSKIFKRQPSAIQNRLKEKFSIII